MSHLHIKPIREYVDIFPGYLSCLFYTKVIHVIRYVPPDVTQIAIREGGSPIRTTTTTPLVIHKSCEARIDLALGSLGVQDKGNSISRCQ
jgi:hypothetical protein